MSLHNSETEEKPENGFSTEELVSAAESSALVKFIRAQGECLGIRSR